MSEAFELQSTGNANWRHIIEKIILQGLLVLAVTLAPLVGTIDPARAQGEIESNHGDWNLFCDTPPGAPGKQCSLVQNVVAEDKPNIGLTVVVLKTADGKNWLMRVLAPLGVLLPSGLGLRIDDADVGRTAFVRCLANGCIAEAVMQPELLEKLQKGEDAMFIVFESPEQGIGVFVSLNGFKEGLDQLQQ